MENEEELVPIIKEETLHAFQQNFPLYYSVQLTKRSNIIKQNLYYKSRFHLPSSSEKHYYKVNETKDKVIELPPSTSFKQNFYCYPIKENFLCESNYMVPYFEYFPLFKDFNKSMTKQYDSIAQLFHFIPSTPGQAEIIENKYFFIWSFICIVLSIQHKQPSIEFHEDNVYKIIEEICSLLEKTIKYMYRIIANYTMPTQHFIQLKELKPINLFNYRNCFCPFCLKYLCRLHFFNSKIELTYHDFYLVKTEYKNIIGERMYFNGLVNNLNYKNDRIIESLVKCGPSETECKNNTKVTLINQQGIEENHIEIFKMINKDSFYLLNCLLTSSLVTNSCLFFKLFEEKYPCYILQKIIMICSESKNQNEINNYLTYAKMGGLTFPKIQIENQLITSLKEKESQPGHENIIQCNSETKVKVDYIPCNHLGICTEDNCSCKKSQRTCEKYCICAHTNCLNAYQGCKCTSGCCMTSASTVDSKCLCLKNERECDPVLCKKCCKKNNCRNMGITNKQFKKTVVAESYEIKAAGLFASEDIEPYELINEYLGEIVEKDELERRFLINEPFDRHYGFSLTDKYDIDALRCGNELRYVNHASYGYDNCFARGVYVQGLMKIALYSSRRIMSGEEFYFDYHMKNCKWITKYNKKHGNI